MFWNKRFYFGDNHINYISPTGTVETLVGHSSIDYLKEEIEKRDVVIDLILKELGKEYVPESSKTEPAKLVDLVEFTADDELDAFLLVQAMKEIETKPKKKRRRPKKKQ